MPYALTLKSLDPRADALERLCEAAARFEAEPSMAALGYAPHITLAIYDEIDIGALSDLAGRIARAWPVQHLRFRAVRHFEGPPHVLWAEPDNAPALFAMHAAIHDAIDPARCRPHYRPAAWVPHCSLATAIPDAGLQPALNWAVSQRIDLCVTFGAIDCVAFPPVEILCSQGLRPEPA